MGQPWAQVLPAYLVLLEVAQGLHYDRAAAPELRVTWLQPDDAFGLVDQKLHLPLVLQQPLLFFLPG